MRYPTRTMIVFAAAFGLACLGGSTPQTKPKGMAAAFPWSFDKGTKTARTMAISTAGEIARKAGYASIPDDVASAAWDAQGGLNPSGQPTVEALKAFGTKVKAKVVLYGSVAWHTRSIWVGAGPKTIATATVNVFVFDVRSGRVVYRKAKVEGRSDEKENGYKVAAAILITPVVTAVSGGPATPMEQKAVQIALARAYQRWVKSKS